MRNVLAAALCIASKSKKHPNCHPEAAESHAQASDSTRRIYALIAECTILTWAAAELLGAPEGS
jgi:hypothetical protein